MLHTSNQLQLVSEIEHFKNLAFFGVKTIDFLWFLQFVKDFLYKKLKSHRKFSIGRTFDARASRVLVR